MPNILMCLLFLSLLENHKNMDRNMGNTIPFYFILIDIHLLISYIRIPQTLYVCSMLKMFFLYIII
jgi:hypothetical protein